ncbi:MAG TPA: hypothetical protein VNO70_15535, partial [Blastocatellia bacterium]|nr:hypothetical protein [Blastocatellia bacterium]
FYIQVATNRLIFLTPMAVAANIRLFSDRRMNNIEPADEWFSGSSRRTHLSRFRVDMPSGMAGKIVIVDKHTAPARCEMRCRKEDDREWNGLGKLGLT